MKPFVLLFLLSAYPSLIAPQSAVFDYQREELPSMSLNGLPYYDARLLTFGGNPLMAPTLFSSLANPAALPDHHRISLSLTGKRRSAFQYWGINEGLLTTSRAVSDRDFSFSAAALNLKISRFTIAAGFAETALRAFPSFRYENTERLSIGNFNYRFTGDFAGTEKTCFITLKRDLSRFLAAGVTLSYSRTMRRVQSGESWDISYSRGNPLTDSFALTQREEHLLTNLSLIAGLVFYPAGFMQIGVSLNLPLRGDARREILRELQVPSDHQSTRSEAVDEYLRPATLNGSLMFQIPLKNSPFSFRLGLNLLFCDWSRYRFVFFNSQRTEAMHDTVSISLSLAGSLKTGIGTFDIGFGLRHDPQPLDSADIILLIWSGGLSWRHHWLEVELCLAHIPAEMKGVSIPQTMLTCTSSVRF